MKNQIISQCFWYGKLHSLCLYGNYILFLNLEDDRLFSNRNIEILRQIYEIYLEKIQPKWRIYIFLDEIQLIEWWESFIRTIYEQNNDIEIFLTWSNSYLLSSEISSSLSWRFIEFKIFLLGFKKYYVLNLWIREVEKINFDNDLSKKIENLVFLKLMQDNKKMYYWQDDKQKEIDFIVQNNTNFDKYQIVWNLTIENKDRKLWNFVLWSKYINWENFLITLGNSEELEYKWTRIKKINIVQWLLKIK